jgi:hypothetical protein
MKIQGCKLSSTDGCECVMPLQRDHERECNPCPKELECGGECIFDKGHDGECECAGDEGVPGSCPA